jgi:GrpB-like predicted nucleotidyltransferase (UPF0157 family)
MERPVRIVAYDLEWPSLFKKEKNRIIDIIGHIVLKVEHIGSTAVPNLGGKPIIDIMVAVNHLDDADICIEPLEIIGYNYFPEYEESMPERRYFQKGKQPEEQHYHLHMVELTSEFWERHLLFRDHLRSHPDIAEHYYVLKKKLATKYGSDCEGYTEAKTPFIESAVSDAREENSS